MDGRVTYTERMCARFGFRESRARICPLVVAGKRCRAWKYLETCICSRMRYPIFDHACVWYDARGYVFTAEPYDLRDEDIETVRAMLSQLGLILTVTTESFWFQGTTLLLIHRPGWTDTRPTEAPTLH